MAEHHNRHHQHDPSLTTVQVEVDENDGGGDHDAACGRLRHSTHRVSTTSVRRGEDDRSRRRLRGSSISSSPSSSSSSSPSLSPGPHSHSHTRSRSAESGPRYRTPAAATKAKTRRNTDVRILFLLVALVSLAWSLYQLPLNRVIERRLCVEYYRGRAGLHDASSSSPSSVWSADLKSESTVHLKDGVVGDGEIPEEMCKVDPVQRNLGRIQGFMETGWVVGDFVMTIPLIAIADGYGHGFVLLLNLVPRVVLLGWTFAVGYFDTVLPVNAIIAAPLFSVFGGDCVFNSIVYSLVSGSTDDVVQRATFFGQINAISSIFAYQLGPALASASMSVLLWLPLWFGIILLLLAVPAVSLLNLDGGPISLFGNRRNKRHGHKRRRRESHELEEGSPLLSAPASQTKLSSPDLHVPELVHSIRKWFAVIVDVVTTYPRNFIFLLAGFFLTSLASSDTKLLTQYISKRYHWKFVSVGYLLSVKAVFNFFLLYFVIPALLRWSEERGLPRPSTSASACSAARPGLSSTVEGQYMQQHDSRQHDKQLKSNNEASTIRNAHICLVFSVLGATAIGSSSTIYLLIPSLLLYALGIALPMFTYSLLKSPAMFPPPPPGDRPRMVASEHFDGENEGTNTFLSASTTTTVPTRASSISGSGGGGTAAASTAQIFSIVMLVKTSGMLVGAPLMASLWVYGLGVGGAGLGLPYFVSAVCYGLVVLIFSKIQV